MNRRAFLATATGTLAALTGCLDGADPGTEPPTEAPGTDPDPTGSATPTGTPTVSDEPTPEADVTVDALGLQYGFVAPDSPDSIGIASPTTPYVVADVAVEGSLAFDEFAVAVGDERVRATRVGNFYRTAWGSEEWYGRDRARGLLAFDLGGVPATPGGDVALTWPGGAQTVGDAAMDRLARGAPEFSASLAVPGTQAGTTAPPVSVEVTNDGDLPARFLGALNRTGPLVAYTPVARLGELVGAGETTTIEVADEWGGDTPAGTVGDDDPDVRYFLHYGDRETSAEVRLVESN